jgi:CBS domain-containing protein
MQLRDIMTKGFQMIDQSESVRRAAELMRDLDVGMLPVLEENQLVGTITDRDITVRSTATGASPDEIPVRNVMSRGVIFGYEDDDAQSAAATMEEKQVRRLLVLDHGDKCVGVVSIGDLALRGSDQALSGEVLQRVSQPGAQPSA